MKNNPLVSIIIPTYNRASLIGKTIDSIIAQTYKNWEIIIVDDGSSDNTYKIIEPYLCDLRIRFFNRPSDRAKGGNAARNYGYEISRGEFVKWLDSDDLLISNCLERQIEFVKEGKEDVIFCRSRFFVQKHNSKRILQKEYWHPNFPLVGNYLENFILGKIRFSNNDGLWRRNAIGSRPYSEEIRNSQEFLMIIRMLSKNLTVKLIDETLILVRQHDDRMAKKRSFSFYIYNQIKARYFAILILKENKKLTKDLYTILVKTQIHYITKQILKLKFRYFTDNLNLINKTFLISCTKGSK